MQSPVAPSIRGTSNIDLFARMASKNHFEETKIIFDVDTKERLRQILRELEDKYKRTQYLGYGGPRNRLIPLYNLIDKEKIATIK